MHDPEYISPSLFVDHPLTRCFSAPENFGLALRIMLPLVISFRWMSTFMPIKNDEILEMMSEE